jgi:hypothetical protein
MDWKYALIISYSYFFVKGTLSVTKSQSLLKYKSNHISSIPFCDHCKFNQIL